METKVAFPGHSIRLLIHFLILAFLVTGAWSGASAGITPHPYYHFHRLNQQHGLPHTTVFSIIQDRTGFIWIGTRNGVVKYDGTAMEIFRHDPKNPNSLSHNDAGGVLEDRQGNIWVRTWGGGLNRIHPDSGAITRYRHNEDMPSSLSGDRVQTLFEDSRGRLWAGTFNRGLNRFRPESGDFIRYLTGGKNSLSNNRIWAMAETFDGILWIGTDRGLNRLDVENDTIQAFFPTGLKADDAPGDHGNSSRIRALLAAPSGRLWVGTEKGVLLFDPATEAFSRPVPSGWTPPELNHTPVNILHRGSRSRLWVGTLNRGLYLLDENRGRWQQFIRRPGRRDSISHNDIRCLMEDRSGVLWVGTRGGGVDRLSLPYTAFEIYESTEKNTCRGIQSIHALSGDARGGLWVGAWYHGLSRLDPNGNCRRYTSPPLRGTGAMDIHTLLPMGTTLLAGTWGNGILAHDDNTGMLSPFPPGPGSSAGRVITALTRDGQGKIWAGSRAKGLFWYAPGTWEETRVGWGGRDRTITALLADNRNRVWAGTASGLFSVDGTAGAAPGNKNTEALLPDHSITALALGRLGDIWAGTDQGLVQLDSNQNKIREYNKGNGLAGERIQAIQTGASGGIWMSTDRGISRLDPATGLSLNFSLPLVFNPGAAAHFRVKRRYPSPMGKTIYPYPSPSWTSMTLKTTPTDTGSRAMTTPGTMSAAREQPFTMPASGPDDIFSRPRAPMPWGLRAPSPSPWPWTSPRPGGRPRPLEFWLSLRPASFYMAWSG